MNGDAPKDNRCQAVNKDGQRCGARAMKTFPFCLFHNPSTANERTAARKAGGVQRSQRAAVLPADMPDWPLTSAAELAQFLAFIVNAISRGQLEVKIGYILAPLLSILMKALDVSNVEKRLADVE